MTDRVAEMISAKLAELDRTDVHFEVCINVMPTPQGPQPMLTIIMAAPAVTIGEMTSTMGMMPDLCPPQQVIEEAVLKMLEGLRNNLQMETEAIKAQSNGHGQVEGPLSGLIVPGR